MTSGPQSSRRDFLQGRAAVRAVEAIADQLGSAGPGCELPPPGEAETYLVQLSRRAMACEFQFYLNAGQYPQGTEAALAGLDLVDALEDQLTVYRPHSEISRLNAQAATGPVEVEPRLFELLALAVDIHRQTDGAFDITAGPLSEIWGFTRRVGAVPDAARLAAALECVGTRWLVLDRARRSVAFSRSGIQINLGAIGKGYALDRVAELLASQGVGDFLLHGGHSSVLARGNHGGLPAGTGWLVGVRHPLRTERRLGELKVADQALATSGSGTQFFEHGGRRYGHILDPRSGWPAEGVLSSTVLAPSAALADALSTAFYVLGPAAAAAYCGQHAEVGSLLVTAGGRVGAVEVHTSGIAPGKWLVYEQ